MELTFVHGSSNHPLAERVARLLGVETSPLRIERFPDGEMKVDLVESPRARDVYVLQSTHPPVGENLLELMLVVDAFRRGGAGRITAVVPYFGYARQDRRAHGRESLGSRLVADLLITSGIDRIVGVDLHTPSIEGCFSVPLEHLTAVPVLADRVKGLVGANAVVVSPDLGAVKLAERYAERLGVPMAVVHKIRTSGSNVKAQGVVGEVSGRVPILVDDMITTAGTMQAAAQAVLEQGAVPEIYMIASHGVLVGPAAERLKSLPIARIFVTDSIPEREAFPLPVERVSIAPLIAETVRRLHGEKPLSDLIANR